MKAVVYYLKFCVFQFVIFFVLTVSIPFMLIRPKNSRNGMFGAFILVQFCKLLSVKVNIEGAEKVDKNESFIVIMNHQSSLDTLVVANLIFIMGDLTSVVKKELMYIPLLGIAIFLCDGIFIDRNNRDSSIKSLQKLCENLRNNYRNLIMCPEGTRHDGNELLPFKKGAFHMSAQSNMKILPVVVQKYPFINHGKKVFGRGEVKVKMLSPIEKQWFENIDDFTKRVYNLMNDEYQLMNQVIQ